MVSQIKVDSVLESSSGNGVTVDGVLLKDNVAHSGLVKLGSATASNDSSIIFDNFVDTSTYISYKIIIDELTPGTDCGVLQTKYRSSSGNITGTYYRSGYWASMYRTGGASGNSQFYTNASDTDYTRTAGGYGTQPNESISCEIDFYPNNNDELIRMVNNNIYNNCNGDWYTAQDACILQSSTAAKGLLFFMSSGNIASGEFAVYGVKK